jgi:nickel-dependent lactate racemase
MPKVAFGKEELEFELDPGDTLTEKEPADSDYAAWDPESLHARLQNARFDEFLDLGNPLIVVNDSFRPTPTGAVLSQLKSWYPAFTGDFIVACGNHPAPQKNDLDIIFGDYRLPENSRLIVHDSGEKDSMAQVGEFDGQPILLNRAISDYSSILVIGSVEPHYFAGYTGGRKSIIPGLCDIETTRRNHVMAVSDECRPLRLEGNPLAENLDQLLAAVKIPPVFSIQIVAGRNQKILDCFAGNIADSFVEAVSVAEKVYGFAIAKQYDLVIAEVRPPLDRNLYQLQKAIENTAVAVRDEGTLMAVSRCPEGIGNDEFYQLAGRLENEEMVLSYSDLENAPLGIHKLSRVVRLADRIRVCALTGLKHEILDQVYIEPAVSIEAEMQKLRQGDKKDLDILLVRDAGLLAAKSD